MAVASADPPWGSVEMGQFSNEHRVTLDCVTSTRRTLRLAVLPAVVAGSVLLAACGGGTKALPTSTSSPALSTTVAPASTNAATTSLSAVDTTTSLSTTTTSAAPTTTAFSLQSLPGKIAVLTAGCGQPLSQEDLASLGTIQSAEDLQNAIGGMIDMALQVCVMNPDGTDLQVVSDPNRPAEYPSWSHDGSVLFFVDDRGTIVLNPDGSNARRFKKGVDPWPSTSPNGKWYSFSKYGDTRFWIAAVGANAATVRKPVTPRSACCETTRWSPDSRYLLYTQYEGSGQSCLQLWKVDIETMEQTKLTGKDTPSESTGACVYPDSGRWSPDGSTILFELDVDVDGEKLSRPYLIGADGSDPRALLADDAFGDPSWVLGAIAWSPDGRAVVLGAVTATGAGNGAYIVSADGKNVVRIDAAGTALAAAAEFAWAPGL